MVKSAFNPVKIATKKNLVSKDIINIYKRPLNDN